MRKKLLIIFACCLCGFAAAFGGAVWWGAAHLRSPEFRGELTHLLEKATGREVRIAGGVRVSVFPWLGISMDGFSLGDDPAFGTRPLLTAETISAHVRVLPILRHRLVFGTVDLRGAKFRFILNKKKIGNWEAVIANLRRYEEENFPDEQEFFRKITMRGLRIESGTADLDDRRHGFTFSMPRLALSTGRIEKGRPLPFDLDCDFNWPQPGITSSVTAKGRFDWSGKPGTPILDHTTARAEIGGTFLPRGVRARLTTQVGTARKNRDLVLDGLRLRLLGADFTGRVTFFEVTDHYRMTALLRTRPFNPRAVIDAYWPGTVPTQRKDALRTASGPLDLYGDEDGLTFASPGLRLDGSTVRGRVRMGFEALPGLTFALAVDRLDADAYAAAFTTGSRRPPLVVGDLPAAYLRWLKGSGTLRAGRLTAAGLAMTGVNLFWKAASGRHDLTFRLDDTAWGRADGGLSATLSGGPPEPKEDSAPPAAHSAAPLRLAFSGALRMDGVDVRRVNRLNRKGITASGRLALNADVRAAEAVLPAGLELADVPARAAVSLSAAAAPLALDVAREGKGGAAGRPLHLSLGSLRIGAKFPAAAAGPKGGIRAVSFSAEAQPLAVDIPPAEGGAAPSRPQYMRLTSVRVRAKVLPLAKRPAEGWAGRLEGDLAAAGSEPKLSLETKVTGRLSSGAGGGILLSGASAAGRLRGWFLPRSENTADFSFSGGADLAAQRLHVTALSVRTCGLDLTGRLEGTHSFGRAATLAGRIRCRRGDPRRLLAALDVHPPKSADRHVFSHLSGEADMRLSSAGLRLSDITAEFDGMPISGSYAVEDFSAPRQVFALSAGALDVDRYLPAPLPVRHDAPERKPKPRPLPVDLVRGLSARGTLAFRSFKLHKLTTQDLRFTLAAGGGRVVVRPIAGRFYGGGLSGEFTARALPRALATRLSLVLRNFRSGPLMADFGGKKYVTGTTNMFLDVTGSGATDEDVLRSLSGVGEFRVTDGAYAFSGAADRPAPKASAAEGRGGPQQRRATTFGTAGARFRVRNGVFSSNNFRLVGPRLVVTGGGRFSLAQDSIEVELTADMPGFPDVPLRVHGRLKDPQMDVPTIGLFSNTLKELLGLPFKPFKFFRDLLF